MIIAFYNFKGGVGTTTLVAHTCALAQELGLRVAGVSADFRYELPRWLGTLKIPCITPDRAEDEGFDLIVIDVQSHSEPPIEPDVWVLPISDAASAERACEVSDRLQGPLIWLGNKGRRAPEVPTYLLGAVEVARPMPYSRALDRANLTYSIVWNVPELAGAAGAWALRASLENVLDRAFAARGSSLSRAVVLAKMRHTFDELAATRAAAEACHGEVRGALEVLKTRAEAARVPVAQPVGLTAGQVLRMTEAEPPRVTDPGLDAVLSQVRALLANEPDPLSPNEVRLAAVTGRKTVDEWLASLARAGHELVCGLRTAQQIAERLSPSVEVGYRALLHPQTILRFKIRPGRARLDTLVRIAIASGRADILELRGSERTVDQPPAGPGWPHTAPALRTVN